MICSFSAVFFQYFYSTLAHSDFLRFNQIFYAAERIHVEHTSCDDRNDVDIQ